MQLSLLSFIYFVAFSHSLLLIAILLRRSELGKPGILLAGLLMVLAYKQLEGGIEYSSLYQQLPHLLNWLPGSVLFMGPLFLAYVQRMAGQKAWSLLQWCKHLLPGILVVSLVLPKLFVAAQTKIDAVEAARAFEGIASYPWYVITLLISWKIHLAGYLYTAWIHLRDLEHSAEHQRSDDSQYCIGWQKKLCLALMLLEATWVALFVSEQYAGFVLLNQVGQSWLLLMSVIILLMGYWGLQHPQLILEPLVFDSPQNAAIETNITVAKRHSEPAPDIMARAQDDFIQQQTERSDSNVIKYANTAMDQSTALAIAQSIKECFENLQLHLNSNLKLSELADAIGIRTHLVSQVINETLDTTFFKLVNSYRVEHAKQMLHQGVSFTLEQIAVESGFNNRVTFNKAFKELEGVSPSLYRKELSAA